MFGPRIPARERILAMGPEGSGKSTAPLDIAIKIPEVTVWVVDTDRAWTPEGGRMNPCDELPNVKGVPAYEFPQIKPAIEKVSKQAKRDDWLVVDMLGPQAWDGAQEFYTEVTKGKEIEDFYLEFMKKSGNRGKNPFEGDTDWVAIKKLYGSVIAAILNFPGHVYCTSGVKAIGDRDEAINKRLFGPYGVRPDGEKRMGHVFSTVLLMRQKTRDEWTFTTVKDRNGRVGYRREYVENKPWADFSKQYLWECAGWRPGR